MIKKTQRNKLKNKSEIFEKIVPSKLRDDFFKISTNFMRIAKPNFTRRTERYSFVDMHVHTDASYDCRLPVKKVIDYAKKHGIGVAITDHNEIKGALAGVDYALEKNVLLIPAIEVHSAEGAHVVFYFWQAEDLARFYAEQIERQIVSDPFYRIKIRLADIIHAAKNYHCLASIPHPFVKAFTGVRNVRGDEYWGEIDAIESMNSLLRKKANLTAVAYAQKYNLAELGGSDAHFFFEIGTALTRSQGNTCHDFLEAVKNKKTKVFGRERNFPSVALTGLIKEKRSLARSISEHTFGKRVLWLLKTCYPYFKKSADFKLPLAR